MNLSLSDHMTPQGVDKWFEHLNASNAPLPHQNVKTALKFFQMNMPRLPPEMALNFLLAMDLSRSVQAIQLRVDEELIAFRTGNESPFKLFYTRPGGSKFDSGVNPAGRSAVRFKVRQSCPALESYTTGAIDVWTIPSQGQPATVAPRANSTGYMASGGGIQLIVPNAHSVLLVV